MVVEILAIRCNTECQSLSVLQSNSGQIAAFLREQHSRRVSVDLVSCEQRGSAGILCGEPHRHVTRFFTQAAQQLAIGSVPDLSEGIYARRDPVTEGCFFLSAQRSLTPSFKSVYPPSCHTY